jgi:EpsI family protein
MSLVQRRFAVVNSVLLLTLLGSYWGQRTAGAAASFPTEFLSSTTVPLQGWTYTEMKLTEHEREILKPDAVLLRNYRSPKGEMVQLAVIAGHRKQTVHTPAFCMTGGGWNTTSTRDWSAQIGDVAVSATKASMMQGQQRLLAIYFFSDGSYGTRSLPRFQAEQFLQRVRGQVPMGALVRVLVPVAGQDEAAAERLADRFLRAALPDVLRRIHLAHNK